MKVYECINLCLKAYGCRTAFGVPGSYIMPVWQNLQDLELIVCSHEAEASYAATGFGKMTKTLTAVLSTGGPGTTNCISGIAAANLDSIPMIYISGCSPISSRGKGLRQEEGSADRDYDSVQMLKTVVKRSVRAHSAEEAVYLVEQLCRESLRGRPGCTHLSLPIDIQTKEIDNSYSDSMLKRAEQWFNDYYLTPSLASDFVINGKTLIIMGWGCWLSDVVDDVYVLAEKIKAPVLVTTKAYCCIRNHPYFLGKLGYGENRVLKEFIESYKPEIVIGLGTTMGIKDLSEEFLKTTEGAAYHVFTREAKESCEHLPHAKWHETEDLKQQLQRIETSVALNEDITDQILKCRADQYGLYRKNIDAKDNMASLIYSINKLISSDTVVTADAGNHLLNTGSLLFPEQNGTYLFLDDGIRAMGSGICETIGMSIARPELKYIAITGDGCVLMNGNAFHVAKQQNAPILFVIMVNHSLGRVRVGQMKMGSRFIGTDINGIDFALYARSFGLLVYDVDSTELLEKQVKMFFKNPCPTALICYTNKDEVPIPLVLKGEWN